MLCVRLQQTGLIERALLRKFFFRQNYGISGSPQKLRDMAIKPVQQYFNILLYGRIFRPHQIISVTGCHRLRERKC